MRNRSFIVWLVVLAGCSSGVTVIDPPPTPVIFLPDQAGVETAGMFIDKLTGSAVNNGNTWVAVADVVVLDHHSEPVPGAFISGEWSEGRYGNSSCTTGAEGICRLESDSIRKNVASSVLEITSLSHGSFTYRPELAEQFDDQEPRSIVVRKP